MAQIEVVLDSIRVSMMNYQRVVILKVKNADAYLPIWVGTTEADAIAIKLHGIRPPRPLTHDFTCAVIDALGGNVHSVVINALKKDTFYSKVVLSSAKGQLEIDCRPSDALAIAIRTGAPILVEEKVLEKAGIRTEKETTGRPISPERSTASQELGGSPLQMFDDSALDILSKAEMESKRLGHGYISTAHLLVALLKEESAVTEIFEGLGIDPVPICLATESLMGEGRSIEGGGTGLTSPVKEVIRTSVAEAKRLGSQKVLPEHILLGLVRSSGGIAAKQLEGAGIVPEAIYAELIRLYTQR